jgi:hypothetical protein
MNVAVAGRKKLCVRPGICWLVAIRSGIRVGVLDLAEAWDGKQCLVVRQEERDAVGTHLPNITTQYLRGMSLELVWMLSGLQIYQQKRET